MVVRVEDETEKFQLRGKQTLNARGIWYTQVSGIWQTVWLEQVSIHHIQDLKISTDAQSGSIIVRPITQGIGKVRIVVKDGDKIVAEGIDAKMIELKIQTPNSGLLPLHIYTPSKQPCSMTRVRLLIAFNRTPASVQLVRSRTQLDIGDLH